MRDDSLSDLSGALGESKDLRQSEKSVVADKALRQLTAQRVLDRSALIVLLVGALASTTAFLFAFFITPIADSNINLVDPTTGEKTFAYLGDKMITAVPLFSQKIFYFHMPVAIVSFGALLFTAIFGVLFLAKRNHKYDLSAKVASEIALVFILMTMVSGELWERHDWQVWWTWEPRLTSYLILMLLVIGYFILRAAIEDPERRAAFASVFGIIAFIDAIISLIITRLVPTNVHPVVFRAGEGFPPLMLIPLLLSLLGMFCIAFGLYRFRLSEQRLRCRLEDIKTSLED